MNSILKNAKITLCAIKAADNEELTGTTLDMQGYDSVIFIAGAVAGEAADFTINAEQDSASDMSTKADLAGSSVTFSTTTSANAQTALEIHQPRERYVRAILTAPDLSAAKAAVLFAIQFNAKDAPYASNAGEIYVSPAEGTA